MQKVNGLAKWRRAWSSMIYINDISYLAKWNGFVERFKEAFLPGTTTNVDYMSIFFIHRLWFGAKLLSLTFWFEGDRNMITVTENHKIVGSIFFFPSRVRLCCEIFFWSFVKKVFLHMFVIVSRNYMLIFLYSQSRLRNRVITIGFIWLIISTMTLFGVVQLEFTC